MKKVIALSKEDTGNIKPIEFTFEILKKRLLSSHYAFNISIRRFFHKLDLPAEEDRRFIEYTLKKLTEDYDNDIEKQEDEAELIDYTSRTVDETQKIGVSERLLELAEKLADKSDSKLKEIESFINKNLKTDGN